MKKEEIKKILKPLIKECIKEVLFEEEGSLSHIIREVAGGLSNKQQIVEAKFTPPKNTKKAPQNNKAIAQTRKRLLDAIGTTAYNGIDIFEGVTPTSAPIKEGAHRGPLADVAPNDPGVDISNLFGEKAFVMTQKMMEKK